jgi:uncharacterized protein (UPF0264 family)
MRLLVSVANAEEAAAALAGGADIIDAKDPFAGALGAVPLPTLRSIVSCVDGARPVTAALGDASDAVALERAAREFAECGTAFVKIGFAGIESTSRIAELIAVAVSGARAGGDKTGVVAVAYADAVHATVPFEDFTEAAALHGAKGVLIDTADKLGPGLRHLVTPATLARWVAAAHDAKLFIAVAGKLTADDLEFVRQSSADIAGVRGAACEGGRTGHVSSKSVLLLHTACTDKERAALAAELIQSLDTELDADAEMEWSKEIRARLDRVDAGTAKTISWSEARRRIHAAAGRDSRA